jgi:hypothetical protein
LLNVLWQTNRNTKAALTKTQQNHNQMEAKFKPQIQSTVYPEIPCSNFNEWINYIKKEGILNSKVSEGTHSILLNKFSSLQATYTSTKIYYN